jgi:hypothetical protein
MIRKAGFVDLRLFLASILPNRIATGYTEVLLMFADYKAHIRQFFGTNVSLRLVSGEVVIFIHLLITLFVLG